MITAITFIGLGIGSIGEDDTQLNLAIILFGSFFIVILSFGLAFFATSFYCNTNARGYTEIEN